MSQERSEHALSEVVQSKPLLCHELNELSTDTNQCHSISQHQFQIKSWPDGYDPVTVQNGTPIKGAERTSDGFPLRSSPSNDDHNGAAAQKDGETPLRSRFNRIRQSFRSIRDTALQLRRSYPPASGINTQLQSAVASSGTELSHFILQYAHLLPLEVMVEEGHSQAECEVSSGDIYVLHFLRRSRLVEVRKENRRLLVPLYSGLEYSLLHCIDGDLEGSSWKTAGDIMAANPLPRVVYACASFDGGAEECSVNRGETLAVLRIKRKRFVGHSVLVTYSFTKRMKKYLDGRCIGEFSTRRECIRLPMKKILGTFKASIFPCKAMLSNTLQALEPGAEEWLDRVVTVFGLVDTETVIITKKGVGEERNRFNVFEMPTTTPIIVSLRGNPSDATLVSYTNELYSNFDPTKTELFKPDFCVVLRAVQRGYEREGLQWKLNDSKGTASYETARYSEGGPDGSSTAPTDRKRDNDGERDTHNQYLIASIKELKNSVGDIQKELLASRAQMECLINQISDLKREMYKLCTLNNAPLHHVTQLHRDDGLENEVDQDDDDDAHKLMHQCV